ncbi:hypothetical protein MTR_8g017620 [Medicago truncatula]|uniref:Uncharacterized protein n=1 Tax=Medicago truncatula TaxID=3880 RepID=A0A072TMK2_MEDTR|nr:hypothetical protein MTR_8g017620 [Medicago truncatula]
MRQWDLRSKIGVRQSFFTPIPVLTRTVDPRVTRIYRDFALTLTKRVHHLPHQKSVRKNPKGLNLTRENVSRANNNKNKKEKDNS